RRVLRHGGDRPAGLGRRRGFCAAPGRGGRGGGRAGLVLLSRSRVGKPAGPFRLLQKGRDAGRGPGPPRAAAAPRPSMTAALAVSLLLAATGPAQAERMAAEAVRLGERQPEAALAQARRALALTAEFDPTVFVAAGRKGEVVEDGFVKARNDYRRHRSGLYDAVGRCLARLGRHLEAGRYLGRAVLLESTPARVTLLARELLAEGRARPALDRLAAQAAASRPSPEALALLEEAADAAGVPSAQAEIDRARLAALGGIEARE